MDTGTDRTVQPDITAWTTIGGAAQRLDLSRRTIIRMIQDGRLIGHWPVGASRRLASALLRTSDVDALHVAQRWPERDS